MTKATAAAKSGSIDSISAEERALAAQLFVKLYDPSHGRTGAFYADKAIEAAKSFYELCPPIKTE